MEEVMQKFSSYAEAMEWVAEGQRKYGKKAFTARPEYREAYPHIKALADVEGVARKRRRGPRPMSSLEMMVFGKVS